MFKIFPVPASVLLSHEQEPILEAVAMQLCWMASASQKGNSLYKISSLNNAASLVLENGQFSMPTDHLQLSCLMAC